MKKRTETTIKAGLMAITFIVTSAVMNSHLDAMRPSSSVIIDPDIVDIELIDVEKLAEMCETETIPTLAETTTFVEHTAEEIYQPSYNETEKLLLKVASCEAGDQGIEGMALVLNVITNRANLYQCSIQDVIYAPGQFACLDMQEWNNDYIATGAYEALELVRNGWDQSQGAMYFCTPSHNKWHSSHLTYLFTYKGHEFYK